MDYTAVIEIPKGTDRRVHAARDKNGFVDLGPILEHVPVNKGVMPVHYGYIPETLNPDDEDEVDVIVFSNKTYTTGDVVEIKILGMLVRADGDNKVIARDDSVSDTVFEDILDSERKLIVDFMGYTSAVISIQEREEAVKYLKSCLFTPKPIS